MKGHAIRFFDINIIIVFIIIVIIIKKLRMFLVSSFT